MNSLRRFAITGSQHIASLSSIACLSCDKDVRPYSVAYMEAYQG